ncbi:MAG: hypothetical protein AAGA69_08035, partial [Pseudomonadota bacterium]
MNALLQLIAHEYRKYVFTRGFLLFILIIPMAGLFGYFAGEINDRAAPVRHFVVIDDTGEFLQVIDDALEERKAEDTVSAWDAYAAQWVMRNEDGTWPLPPLYVPGPVTPDRVDAFETAGGLEAAMAAARPYLREGAPEVPTVRARYVRVEMPPEAASAATSDAKVQALLPYLNGKKTLDGDRALFAVVVIPEWFRDGLAATEKEAAREARKAAFWTNNLIASDLNGFIGGTLGRALRNEAFVDAGLDVTVVDQIRQIRVSINEIKADQDGGEDGAAA